MTDYNENDETQALLDAVEERTWMERPFTIESWVMHPDFVRSVLRGVEAELTVARLRQSEQWTDAQRYVIENVLGAIETARELFEEKN